MIFKIHYLTAERTGSDGPKKRNVFLLLLWVNFDYSVILIFTVFFIHCQLFFLTS